MSPDSKAAAPKASARTAAAAIEASESKAGTTESASALTIGVDVASREAELEAEVAASRSSEGAATSRSSAPAAGVLTNRKRAASADAEAEVATSRSSEGTASTRARVDQDGVARAEAGGHDGALASSRTSKDKGNAVTDLPAWLFPILLFLGAFALRMGVAQWLADVEPVWDGHYYDFGARRIAEGHGYSDDRITPHGVEWHPWCHYPVGYSAYLAFFYKLLGSGPHTQHIANALSGALVALVVYLLAKEGLGERRARFAGLFTALHPGLVLYGALVMGEVLAALTVMASFWLAIAGTRRYGALKGIAAGAIMLGIGALVRPQALLCAPFLALAVPRRQLQHALIACVISLLPVLPWTARNCAVMDGCAIVSTNAGWNLAIGSFPRATGRFETLRSSDGCKEVTGQVQQDRCWLHYGIANIKAEPGRWLGLIPAKLSNTFDHESFAVEYLREARPQLWPEYRRVLWRLVLSTLHRALVLLSPLAFVAFALKEKRRPTIVQGAALAVTIIAALIALTASTPTFWPIVLATCVLAVLPLPGRPKLEPALLMPIVLVATTALTHAVFFGDDRYHIVTTPAFCLLAAALLRRPQNTHGADTEVRAPWD